MVLEGRSQGSRLFDTDLREHAIVGLGPHSGSWHLRHLQQAPQDGSHGAQTGSSPRGCCPCRLINHDCEAYTVPDCVEIPLWVGGETDALPSPTRPPPMAPFFFTLSLAHTRPGVLCLAGLGRGLCGVVCRSACLPARPSARLSGHHRQPSLASAAQHTAHSTQPARSYLPNSPKLPRSYQRCVSSGSANVPTSPDRPANCRGEELDSPAPLPLQEKKKPQLAMSDVAWLSLNEIDCLSAI